MKVEFYNFSRQNKQIEQEVQKEISEILNINDIYCYEKKVGLFEKAFAEYIGTKYAFSLDSGTSALQLALLANGIRKDDEVITVANSYIATALAISNIGAKPVFVDVYESTQNIDENKIKKAITKKIKAIIPVHLHGMTAEIDAILDIARENNLLVIEDASQAHGAEYKGKKAGGFGICGCFSFNASKNLGCIDDGGVVTTNSKEVVDTLKILTEPESNTEIVRLSGRTPCRLSPIQASILNIKLRYLDKWNNEKRETAKKYGELITNKDVILPLEDKNSKHVYRDYCIKYKKRDILKEFLARKNIETKIHYKIPIHLTQTFSYLGYKKNSFPITERLSREILSLPIFVGIKDEEVQFVADTLNRFK